MPVSRAYSHPAKSVYPNYFCIQKHTQPGRQASKQEHLFGQRTDSGSLLAKVRRRPPRRQRVFLAMDSATAAAAAHCH